MEEPQDSKSLLTIHASFLAPASDEWTIRISSK